MLRIFLFIMTVICTPIGYSQECPLLEHILTNEDLYVQRFEEDRIYLNPEHISLNEHGIFLEKDTVAIPMAALYSDVSGCYIVPVGKFEILNRCKGCGNSYFIRCRTQGCRFNPDTPKQ